MNPEYGYYYLHVNGQLRHKPIKLFESDINNFNSPFVYKSWKVETEEQYTEMIKEVEDITTRSIIRKEREKYDDTSRWY